MVRLSSVKKRLTRSECWIGGNRSLSHNQGYDTLHCSSVVKTKRVVLSGGNAHQSGVDLGDGVVEDGLELVARSVSSNVNVLEISIEAVVGESDLSWIDRHEPHLKMLKTLHLGEVITPQIIDLPSFLWVCCIVSALIRIISMTRIVSSNDHHVIVVLVLTLSHVGQSTLHSILHILTHPTTKTI